MRSSLEGSASIDTELNGSFFVPGSLAHVFVLCKMYNE